MKLNHIKSIGVVVFLGFCLSGGAGEEKSNKLASLTSQFYENYRKMQHDYAKNIAEMLDEVDEVEISVLNDKFSKFDELKQDLDREKFFIVAPYKSTVEIKSQSEIHEEVKIKQIREVFQRRLLLPLNFGKGKGCHVPDFGIRMYIENQKIFETSISIKCQNVYFKDPLQSDWISLPPDSIDALRKIITDETELRNKLNSGG